MKIELTEELVASLYKMSGPFESEPEGDAPFAIDVPFTETPAEASLKPLPFRRFLGGDLREGAFAFIWRDSEFLRFLALMHDSDPFNEADPKQDLTWMKGDVMEVFLQPPGGRLYYELHIAPNGSTLELKISCVEEFRADPGGGFESRLCETDMETQTLPLEGEPFGGWAGLISIPFNGLLLGSSAKGAKVSVGRYNYNKKWGEKPEISSISKFSKRIPSFHNPDLWQTIL